MRGLRNERGATAVFTAIVSVMLIGFTALAVDAGALYWDKKELQNGADAAALAIAQSCAEETPGCDEFFGDGSLAQGYSVANKSNDNVLVEDVDIRGNSKNGSVTVRVRSDRDFWFGTVLSDEDAGTVRSSATASWGLIGGATVLPLTVSNCYFPLDAVTGEPLIPGGEIWLPISGSTRDPDCLSGNHYAPGGWGWLDADAECNVAVEAQSWVDGDTGKDVPSVCKELLKALLGETVLIPVFDQTNDLQGNNADFHLVGFAQVTVVAYCFSPGNLDSGGIHYVRDGQDPIEKCTGDNLFIRGIFEEMVDLGATLGDDGADDYGARTVQLTG